MDMLTHFLTGSVFYLTFFENASFWYFVLGAIIFDIDHPLGFLYRSIRNNWNSHQRKMDRMKRWLFFPRTALHSVWGSLLFTLIILVLTRNLFLTSSFFLGTVVHLIIDSLDLAGVKWFWPYVHMRWYIPISFLPNCGRLSAKGNIKYSIYLSLMSALLIVMFFLKRDLRTLLRIW